LAEYKYDGGPKRFTVLGFVPQQRIQRQFLIGDGNMIFQPQTDDEVRLFITIFLKPFFNKINFLHKQVPRANFINPLNVSIGQIS